VTAVRGPEIAFSPSRTRRSVYRPDGDAGVIIRDALVTPLIYPALARAAHSVMPIGAVAFSRLYRPGNVNHSEVPDCVWIRLVSVAEQFSLWQ
jgi:hypothetical protein